MNFKLLLVTFAAAAMAGKNGTVTGNGTSTSTPSSVETSNSGNHLAHAGILGAIVAGGVALVL